MFVRTVLVAAVLSAVSTWVAAADADVTIRNGSDATSAISTTTDGTISNQTNRVIDLSNATDPITFDGEGKTITFVGTGKDGNGGNGNAGFSVERADKVTFENFKSLTFESSKDGQDVGFVVSETDLDFGTSEKAIGSLTFNDVTFADWSSAKRSNVDIFANQVTFKQTDGNYTIGLADVKVHNTGASEQKTTFNGSLNIWKGSLTVEGGSFEAGAVTTDGASNAENQSLKGGSLILGQEDARLEDVKINGQLLNRNAGSVKINAEKTSVTGGISNNDGSDMTIRGGVLTVTSDGSVDVTNRGELSFGTKDDAIGTITIGVAGTESSEGTDGGLYTQAVAGVETITTNIFAGTLNVYGNVASDNGGKAQNVISAVTTTIHAKEGSALSGTAIFKDAGDATQSLTIETEGDSGAVLVSEKSKFNVEAGNVTITGGMQISNGAASTFGGTDGDGKSLGKVVFNTGSTALNGVLKTIDGTFSLRAGELVVNAREDGSQRGIRNENGGTMTLDAGAMTVTNGGIENSADLEGNRTSTLTITGGSLTVNNGNILNTDKLFLGTSADGLESLTITAASSNSAAITTQTAEGTAEAPTTTEVYANNVTLTGAGVESGNDGKSQNVIHAVNTTIDVSQAEKYAVSGTAIFENTGRADQKLTVRSTWSGGTVLISDKSKFAVKNGTVDIQGCIQANLGGTVELGTADNALSSVVLTGEGSESTHVLRSHGGNVNVNADHVSITATDNQTALNAFTNEDGAERGNLTVTAKDYLFVQGDILVGRDDYKDAPTIKQSTLTINGAAETTIRSDIRTHNAAGTDNDLVLKLAGENSSLTGSIIDAVDEGATADITNGTTLTLNNGAQWTNTADSTVTNLKVDGGVIDATGGDVTVAVFEGQGDVILQGEVGNDGLVKTRFIAEKADAESHVAVHYEGITSDDVVGHELDGVDGVAATSYVAGGDLYNDLVQVTDASGKVVSTSYEVSDKLENFRGITAASLVQWRDQVNHLTKRLGDVRAQSGDIGAWARVYGGEYKWGDANRVDMQTTTVQVGGDARVGDWIVGGAFSYSDSSFDLDRGSADGELFGLAVYGSKLFENGAYLDLVARYGHLKNEVSVEDMNIDTKSNAFGLSAEVGHQFRFLEAGYVEPQFEVSYGFVEGDVAKASRGVKIDQDDYQNLVTRIGVRTGFDFPKEAGTIYAHVSYSYDFLGEADAKATKGNARPVTLDEDLGGGWVTYGIGGQFRLGESSYAYGELERSTGGDVENPWAFNVGYRYLF